MSADRGFAPDPAAEDAPAMSDRESALAHDDKLELRLWLRLLTCSAMIEREVRTRLRERFDITLPRFDLMAQLDRAPGGLTMGELSSRLMVSNGNVTGLADRLVQEGLVAREPEAADRRTFRVRLTSAGKIAFDAMTPVHEGWIEAMLHGLDPQDMASLLALLGRLKRSLKASSDGRIRNAGKE